MRPGIGTGRRRIAASKARRQFLNLVLVGPDRIASTAENQNGDQSCNQPLIGTLLLLGGAFDIFAAAGLRLFLGAVQFPVVAALGCKGRCVIIFTGEIVATLIARCTGECGFVIIFMRRYALCCVLIRLLQEIFQRIIDRLFRRGSGWRCIKASTSAMASSRILRWRTATACEAFAVTSFCSIVARAFA